MSRKIYHYNGHPPIPGEPEMPKSANGARGRMRLRIARRIRKQMRLFYAKQARTTQKGK